MLSVENYGGQDAHRLQIAKCSKHETCGRNNSRSRTAKEGYFVAITANETDRMQFVESMFWLSTRANAEQTVHFWP